MSVMFYLSMQKVGQELCCNYVKVRENLEDLRLSLHGKLSKVCQINTGRLSSRPVPIRPMNLFNLNRGVGTSLIGFIMTYMIVL
jgi:hypothetical protein